MGSWDRKKIGHTGTLDPDATGVLPVCLGKATKLCDLLTDKDKTYEAVMLLGMTTDTQDITGRILEEKSTETLTADKVREVIESFIGDYDQIPPMYSALKVNGKKLYELAREGKVVERKSPSGENPGYPDHRNGSSAGPYGGVVFQRNLYQDSLPRYRRTAWMWRMYGITDPYKSIGVFR